MKVAPDFQQMKSIVWKVDTPVEERLLSKCFVSGQGILLWSVLQGSHAITPSTWQKPNLGWDLTLSGEGTQRLGLIRGQSCYYIAG
jgi:hypothetical protein